MISHGKNHTTIDFKDIIITQYGMLEKPPGKLRTGFTTGTSATAASIAAILSIINQKKLKRLMFYFQKKSVLKFI